MTVLEEVHKAAQQEATAWAAMVETTDMLTHEVAYADHQRVVHALLTLTRQLAKEELPTHSAPTTVAATAPERVPYVAPFNKVVALDDLRLQELEGPALDPREVPYNPLRPERHLRRIPEPPPPIVVPPVEKDPMTVSLTDNQWLELGRLMRGPCPPISPFREQLQKILVEAGLAWSAAITGSCVISDAGMKRFKVGRYPAKTTTGTEGGDAP